MKKAPKKIFPETLATGGRKNKCNLKSKAIEAKIQSEQHFLWQSALSKVPFFLWPSALCHRKKGLGGLGSWPTCPPGSYAPG
jgi:hypothetical protein